MAKKRRRLLKLLFWILVLFVVIQFIPAKKPPVSEQNPNDFIRTAHVPDSVAVLFKNACYDCHSNQTVYPWYTYVAPASWLIVRDVKDGRKHVNFSEWNSFKITKKLKVLDKAADEIKSGDMPFWPFLIMHPKARLTKKERKIMVEWLDNKGEKMFSGE